MVGIFCTTCFATRHVVNRIARMNIHCKSLMGIFILKFILKNLFGKFQFKIGSLNLGSFNSNMRRGKCFNNHHLASSNASI